MWQTGLRPPSLPGASGKPEFSSNALKQVTKKSIIVFLGPAHLLFRWLRLTSVTTSSLDLSRPPSQETCSPPRSAPVEPCFPLLAALLLLGQPRFENV